MLTMITEVFGIKGSVGDLVIAPALMAEQFDCDGNARLMMEFSGKNFDIHFYNPKKTECGERQILEAFCDKMELEFEPEYGVRLTRNKIFGLTPSKRHVIEIKLS